MPHAPLAGLELRDSVHRIARDPMPFLPRNAKHAAQRNQVIVDGVGFSLELTRCLAFLERRALGSRLRAGVGSGSELVTVLDDDRWGDLRELQVPEGFAPIGQVRSVGAAVAELREFVLDVAIDGISERPPASLDVAEVPA